MKFIRISFLVLVLGITANFIVIASAEERGASSPRDVYVYMELKKNTEQDSSTKWEKTDWANQEYLHNDSATPLTTPCPNCKVQVRAKNTNGTTTNAVITVMGDKKTLGNSAIPGTWYISAKRSDFTLLNTEHAGTWTLNGSK